MSCTVFLTALLSATLLGLFESTRVLSELSIPSLSTPDFKIAKSAFLANCDVLLPVAFLNRILLHN